jgi:hypothetical protein
MKARLLIGSRGDCLSVPADPRKRGVRSNAAALWAVVNAVGPAGGDGRDLRGLRCETCPRAVRIRVAHVATASGLTRPTSCRCRSAVGDDSRGVCEPSCPVPAAALAQACARSSGYFGWLDASVRVVPTDVPPSSSYRCRGLGLSLRSSSSAAYGCDRVAGSWSFQHSIPGGASWP